ncbi:MAG: HEPN domain-containing protein [Syntrophobacteraceae bacterium]|jgi:HEPN domain-containing protein
MKPHIEEAQRSLRIATRDLKAFNVLKEASDIDLATACFHAQQAIEKSLKAVLYDDMEINVVSRHEAANIVTLTYCWA